jgi:hypothetical protein
VTSEVARCSASDVSVRADEHDAAPFDSIQVVPGSGADDVDGERNSGGACNTGGGIECSFAWGVSERDEDVAVQVESRAPAAEPQMRGPVTGPSTGRYWPIGSGVLGAAV